MSICAALPKMFARTFESISFNLPGVLQIYLSTQMCPAPADMLDRLRLTRSGLTVLQPNGLARLKRRVCTPRRLYKSYVGVRVLEHYPIIVRHSRTLRNGSSFVRGEAS